MATFTVQILGPAEADLRGILNWVRRHDSPANALALLDKLEAAYRSLEDLPLRGHVLPELELVGYLGFLEIHEGPYRIIYTIEGQVVWIAAILDGRRDMNQLLQTRLLSK